MLAARLPLPHLLDVLEQLGSALVLGRRACAGFFACQRADPAGILIRHVAVPPDRFGEGQDVADRHGRLQPPFAQRLVQPAFAPEVVGDQLMADPGRLRDTDDPGPVETVGAELGTGRGQNGAPGAHGVTLAAGLTGVPAALPPAGRSRRLA